MAVEITSGLQRKLRGYEQSYGALVRPAVTGPAATDVAQRIGAAVDAVNERSGTGARDRLTVIATTDGTGVLSLHTDRDHASALVTALAVELPAHGIDDAALTPLPSVAPRQEGYTEARLMQSWFVIDGTAAEGWPGQLAPGWGDNPSWDSTADHLHGAVDQLTQWALLGADDAQVTTLVQDIDVPVTASSAVEVAHLTVELPRLLDHLYMRVETAAHFRVLDTYPALGLAAISTGAWNATDFKWASHLATHTERIANAGPWCKIAAVVRHRGISGTSALFPFNAGLMGSSYQANIFNDLANQATAGRFFDAHGVMRLPTLIAEQVDLGSQWQMQPLEGGAVLAQHREPAAFYGHDVVDMDTLRAARAALGVSLMDTTGEWVLTFPTGSSPV